MNIIINARRRYVNSYFVPLRQADTFGAIQSLCSSTDRNEALLLLNFTKNCETNEPINAVNFV